MTVEIKKGGEYRSRSGERWVNPQPEKPTKLIPDAAFTLVDEIGQDYRFTATGKFCNGGDDDPNDLIAEWNQTVETPIDNALLGAVSDRLEELRQEDGRTMGEPVTATSDPAALTQERKKTHGDWMLQANVAQELKAVIGSNDGHLEAHQREAVDMIAVKLSRILSGDASFADHWDDIAGYAHLGKGGH